MLVGVLLSLSWAGRPAEAAGQALTVDALLARVQAQYDRITHLQARFRQETRLPGFDQVQIGEGRVWIQKPGRMRWDYSKPERQTIIADGDTLWIYLPEERQVIRDRVQTAMGTRTPALFLAGQGRLTEAFSAAGTGAPVAGEDGLFGLQLTPKEAAFPYTHVELGIDPQSYRVVRVTLVDPAGSATTMWFADIDTDSPIDPALFRFQVPPGVEVVPPPTFPAPR
jgi:outer membrane lipoprotein carrier protein